jgi:hypothetical protein
MKRDHEDPRVRRRRTKLKRYGLTIEDYEVILQTQRGRCAICRGPAPTNVDHDHVTGKVRGILCQRCNIGLGIFYDDPEILKRAIEYLRT